MRKWHWRKGKVLAVEVIWGIGFACLILAAAFSLIWGRNESSGGSKSTDFCMGSADMETVVQQADCAAWQRDIEEFAEDRACMREETVALSSSIELSQNKRISHSTAPSQSTKESAYRIWDKSVVYHGGDEVAAGGKIYRAKWWTLGETPGSADVWEDMKIAAPDSGQPASQTPGSGREVNGSSEAEQLAVQAEMSPMSSQETEKKAGTKVVAYYPSWRSDQSKLRYDIVTHVIYAFAIPTAEGALRPLEGAEQVPELIHNAHRNGAKVLLGVGGWSYNDVALEPVFMATTESSERISAFTDAIVSMCDSYGFDGVDMDWEHPRVDGSSARQYEDMMLELARKLHSRNKLLTCAVLSGVTADGNIYYDAAAQSDEVLSAVDWIHVMAYDGGDGERHSSYEFAIYSALYWQDTRKVPSQKIVLGVPFYARPSWASYGDILAAVPEAKEGDHVNYNGMEVWYNGPETIRKKATYASEHLGGIMIWEITHDTADSAHSLLSAIGESVR